MPLTGEAKTTYNRRYHRDRKANEVLSTLRPREVKALQGIVAGKGIAQSLVDAGLSATSGDMRKRLRGDGDLAEGLRVLLDAEGLTLTELIRKTRVKLDSQRRFGSGEDAIVADDNDAQLRAVEIGLKLHGQAGTIPTAAQPAGGAGGLHYHLHLGELAQPERLIPSLDAAHDVDLDAVDAQVLDSSDDA